MYKLVKKGKVEKEDLLNFLKNIYPSTSFSN